MRAIGKRQDMTRADDGCCLEWRPRIPTLGRSVLSSTGYPPPPDLLESWGYGQTTTKIFEE
jgi:hypothetical protein